MRNSTHVWRESFPKMVHARVEVQLSRVSQAYVTLCRSPVEPLRSRHVLIDKAHEEALPDREREHGEQTHHEWLVHHAAEPCFEEPHEKEASQSGEDERHDG